MANFLQNILLIPMNTVGVLTSYTVEIRAWSEDESFPFGNLRVHFHAPNGDLQDGSPKVLYNTRSTVRHSKGNSSKLGPASDV